MTSKWRGCDVVTSSCACWEFGPLPPATTTILNLTPPPTPKPSLTENVSLIRHELLYVLHAKLLNNNDQESMTVVILTDVSL